MPHERDGNAAEHPVSRAEPLHRALHWIGLALLALWLAFWVYSIGDEFRFATSRSWVPPWSFLGIDFLFPYRGVQARVLGLDPLRQYIGDFRGKYAAPPITLYLFGWTRFFEPRPATVIWMSIIALTIGYATAQAVRVRRALGLWVPPLTFALAAMLWSTPVLFEMERGNLNVWVLITLFIAMNLLRRSAGGRWYFEVLAGLVLAVGAWAKIYPGLLVGALLPLGRWKASLACAAGIVLIGVVWLDDTRQFLRNFENQSENRIESLRESLDWLKRPTFQPRLQRPEVYAVTHSLTTTWPALLGRTPLGSVPGLLGAGAILGATFLLVAWVISNSPNREHLFFPFMLWTIALGTYGLPGSYDYNLFFLLLTALCVWDRRDPIAVHVLMISVAIWWQPFAIPLPPMVFVGLKLFALIPVTALLLRRAWEPAQTAQTPADVEPSRPVAPIVD